MSVQQEGCRALIVTMGAAQVEPWWWPQIESSGLRDRLRHERLIIQGRQQAIGGTGTMQIALRLARLLRRAQREQIDYVFTFEGDLSCYLIGLLQRLPGMRKPRHVILQFITRERTSSTRAKLRHALASFCLGTVHRFICSSRQEVEYYRREFHDTFGRFQFVPFHTDARLLERPLPPTGDYLIAAGRSYRDYATLANAVAGTGLRTIIVCGRQGPGLTTLPPEVEVIAEMPFDRLMEWVAAARLVVLPLEARRISTGQSVLLQAMAFARTTISTRTAGTEDYVMDGETGFLVPPGDSIAMRSTILAAWHDREGLERIGSAARRWVTQNRLPAHYVRDVAKKLGCSPTSCSDRQQVN